MTLVISSRMLLKRALRASGHDATLLHVIFIPQSGVDWAGEVVLQRCCSGLQVSMFAARKVQFTENASTKLRLLSSTEHLIPGSPADRVEMVCTFPPSSSFESSTKARLFNHPRRSAKCLFFPSLPFVSRPSNSIRPVLRTSPRRRVAISRSIFLCVFCLRVAALSVCSVFELNPTTIPPTPPFSSATAPLLVDLEYLRPPRARAGYSFKKQHRTVKRSFAHPASVLSSDRIPLL